MAAKKAADTRLRNVSQWRAAVKRLNEIANQRAEAEGLCDMWDDIIEEIVEETGLPLEGRNGTSHTVTISDLTFTIPKRMRESDIENAVIDAILAKIPGSEDFETYHTTVERA